MIGQQADALLVGDAATQRALRVDRGGVVGGDV
jgi:hypothetical protein